MDHFGIGTTMQGMAHVYIQSARRTGRTTSMIDSLKDGDVVVFMDRREADRVRRMCRDRGLQVDCVVYSVSEPHRIFERSTPKGRTLFDHTWVEHYYLRALERCREEIDHFQRESSGFGQAHMETRHQAEMTMRWPGR